MVYRGEIELSAMQIRAAVEALPFENPKLAAMAISNLPEHDFAALLDRSIERSNRARVPLSGLGHPLVSVY